MARIASTSSTPSVGRRARGAWGADEKTLMPATCRPRRVVGTDATSVVPAGSPRGVSVPDGSPSTPATTSSPVMPDSVDPAMVHPGSASRPSVARSDSGRDTRQVEPSRAAGGNESSDPNDVAVIAGIVAIVLRGVLVFFWFPRRDEERQLLGRYHAEDT